MVLTSNLIRKLTWPASTRKEVSVASYIRGPERIIGGWCIRTDLSITGSNVRELALDGTLVRYNLSSGILHLYYSLRHCPVPLDRASELMYLFRQEKKLQATPWRQKVWPAEQNTNPYVHIYGNIDEITTN